VRSYVDNASRAVSRESNSYRTSTSGSPTKQTRVTPHSETGGDKSVSGPPQAV
jgi:hypothetical protein